jgi:hypothetical protein
MLSAWDATEPATHETSTCPVVSPLVVEATAALRGPAGQLPTVADAPSADAETQSTATSVRVPAAETFASAARELVAAGAPPASTAFPPVAFELVAAATPATEIWACAAPASISIEAGATDPPTATCADAVTGKIAAVQAATVATTRRGLNPFIAPPSASSEADVATSPTLC